MARVLQRWLATAQSARGMSLVDVLVAIGLLSVILLPMLDLGALVRGATPYQRQMSYTLALAKVEELGDAAYRTNNWPTPNGSDEVYVGAHTFERVWQVRPFNPTANDFGAEQNALREAVVTVTCTTCHKTMTPVKVVAVLAKL